MFVTQKLSEEYPKEQIIKIKNEMLDEIGKSIKVAEYSSHDTSLVLPSGHRVDIMMILSHEPWENYLLPVRIALQEKSKSPHLIWFCEVQGGKITKISSMKYTFFKSKAVDESVPTKLVETNNFWTRESPPPVTLRVVWGLVQYAGFSVDPIKAYVLPGDELLDERIKFSFAEIDPKLPNIDDKYWSMIHFGAAIQPTIFSIYTVLWGKYQEYLTR